MMDYSKETMPLPKIETIVDLIKLIEQRPAMYLGGNSLIRLRSFTDGWYFHQAVTEGQNPREDCALRDFTLWLQMEFEVAHFSWDKIIALQAMDDSHGLTLFFELFHRFLSEQDNKMP